MAAVNVRELARNTSKVIGDVARRKRPAIITRGGVPVAAVIPIDAEALDDWILASAPAFVEDMRKANDDLRRGLTLNMDKPMASAARLKKTVRTRTSTREAKASRR
jgi:prevent-host-death family protein